MTMMMLNVKTLYDIIYEAINEQYENGDITFEQANELNELAYDKYIIETSKATKEKRDRLYYGMQDGKNSDDPPILKGTGETDHLKGEKARYSRHYPADVVHKKAVRHLKKWNEINTDYGLNQLKDYKTGKEPPALTKRTKGTYSDDKFFDSLVGKGNHSYDTIEYRSKSPYYYGSRKNPALREKRYELQNKMRSDREYGNDSEYEKRTGYGMSSSHGNFTDIKFDYHRPTDKEKAAREERKEALRNLNDTKPKSMLKKKK